MLRPLPLAPLVVGVVCCLVAGADHVVAERTALDEYVMRPDPAYSFRDTGLRLGGVGWSALVVNMTSQRWLTPNETSQTVWTHSVVVVIPDEVAHPDWGFLWITGGDNSDAASSIRATDEDMVVTARVAVSAGMVAAALYQVPNQPVVFASDPARRRRVEGELISYGWRSFMDDPGRPEWVAQLPMTKAAARALDTLQAVAANATAGGAEAGAGAGAGAGGPSRFIVSGASKRGWTTWLLGAVDGRVAAMAPVVLDALRLHEFLHAMWRNLGGWTFALSVDVELNLTRRWDSPEFARLAALIDPYAYRARLTMPKLAINAVGDEFQMPDDSARWYGGMPGETHLLMVANAEHSMATGLQTALQGMASFARAVAAGAPRPALRAWSIDPEDGRIYATVSQRPRRATMRFGSTVDGKRRDFRWAAVENPCHTVTVFGGCLRPIPWLGQTLEAVNGGGTEFVAAMAPPGEGWRAFYIEFEFDPPTPGAPPFLLTTPVSVVPMTHPFEDCSGEGCAGTVV